MNRVPGRWIAAALCILAAVLTGCSPGPGDSPTEARRTVIVIRPQHGDMTRSITLPGDLIGFYQATLYAKVTGYLKSISVDKGDWVKSGQVLAEIEVPELDQRLARAKADLEVQRVTYQRLDKVWKSDPRLVAREDVDIAQGKYLQAKAKVDELEALVSYTKITAPFDGVITARFVDPGALIKAGGDQTITPLDQSSSHPSGNGASPVLGIAMISTMRTYVYVPQEAVSWIRRGMPAKLTVQNLPGRTYQGTVTRYANSLDLGTRTMLTEIDLKNPNNELYPGMYANVTLDLEQHRNALVLPESAIGESTEGKYVMVVQDGRLRKQPVTVGINSGKNVEIADGLSGRAEVVKSLDAAMESNESVNVVQQKSLPAQRSSVFAETH
jgi:membrane fusion protein (multidrug efflux system)